MSTSSRVGGARRTVVGTLDGELVLARATNHKVLKLALMLRRWMPAEAVRSTCRGHYNAHLSMILGSLALLPTVVPGLSTRPHGGARRSRKYLLLVNGSRVAVGGRSFGPEPATEGLACPCSTMLLVARQVNLHRLLKRLIRRVRCLLRGHEPGINGLPVCGRTSSALLLTRGRTRLKRTLYNVTLTILSSSR